jgi:hypothetical protein
VPPAVAAADEALDGQRTVGEFGVVLGDWVVRRRALTALAALASPAPCRLTGVGSAVRAQFALADESWGRELEEVPPLALLPFAKPLRPGARRAH